MTLSVCLSSTPLQGIVKPNDLERVRMLPSPVVDVFEAETSNESGSETFHGVLGSTMSVFDFSLLREIQICSDVL